MSVSADSSKYTDIVVAVHGIGAQMRFATVRSVATRLAGSDALLDKKQPPPVAQQPLGYFHSDVQGITSVRPLDDPLSGSLATIGFSEVFWADVPQEVVAEGRTLEETKAWARTVVARARVHCARASAQDASIIPPDFDLGTEVLDEIIETIHVLENIFTLADKAGLGHFDLRQILDEYVNDVQLVTEFGTYRTEIIGRFHHAMEEIHERHCVGRPPGEIPRLHIVAHSEGTVVSFLALLHAMSGCRVIPTNAASKRGPAEELGKVPAWLQHVHGYMTIGSPIDKHLLLWPRLWRTLQPRFANTGQNRGQIHWRNYYDYGDPVGFKLETARRWLKLREADMFEFEPQHDIGFARYLLAGKAHNDYWDDPEVFEHFIKDVVQRGPMLQPPGSESATPRPEIRKPATRPLVGLFSPVIPYALSAVILTVGVYLLYKTVGHFVFGELDAMSNHVLMRELGMARTEAVSGFKMFGHVLAITALILGTTLLARIPRLAANTPRLHRLVRAAAQRSKFVKTTCDVCEKTTPTFAAQTRRGTRYLWRAGAFLGFIAGCAAYVFGVDESSREAIGVAFERLGKDWATVGILLSALAVGLLGLATTARARRIEARRDRWLWKGMRPLILSGAGIVCLIVVSQLRPDWFGWNVENDLREAQRAILVQAKIDREFTRQARFDKEELDQVLIPAFRNIITPAELGKKLHALAPILQERPPLWPVFLGTAGFLYLWWLATLLFDLAFVWQRYIRQEICIDAMADWAGDDYWAPKDNSEKSQTPK